MSQRGGGANVLFSVCPAISFIYDSIIKKGGCPLGGGGALDMGITLFHFIPTRLYISISFSPL